MINVFIRGLLGNFGEKFLDFYIQNSFWINAVILIYVLLIFIGNHARRKIEKAVMDYFNDTYGQDMTTKSASWFNKTLERTQPDWERLGKSTWIPIISQKKSIGFRIKSTETIKSIFTAEYISGLFQDQVDENNLE